MDNVNTVQQTPDSMMSVDAAIMNINLWFPDSSGDVSGDIVITALRTLIEKLAPVIVKYGGRISRFSETGITAVFTDDCESALRCAVEFFQNACSGERSVSAEMAVGIHYGSVSMGTVAYGGFSSFIAVSGDNSLARRISEKASSFGSRILVTDSAAAQIRGFRNRYSSRRLGVIRSRFHSNDIELYDVFDGDPDGRKYTKRRSRMFFEKGVELFLAGNWVQARSYFIELLKVERSDDLAKEYIFKCDGYIADPGSDPGNRYIAQI